MKKKLIVLVVLVLLVSLTSFAQAQTQTAEPPASSSVSGTTQSVVNLTFGSTSTAGGFITGQTQSSFAATDPVTATGSASTKVAGTGLTTPGTNSLSSTSTFSGSATAHIDGNPSNLSVFGNGAQSNWATLTGTGQNMATAGNLTGAGFNGSLSDPSNPDCASGRGNIDANGKSSAALTETPTSVNTSAMTTGKSSAGISFHGNNATTSGTTMVNGNGLLGTYGFVQDPTGNMSAGSSLQGTAAYSVPQSGLSAAGSLKVSGSSASTIAPTQVQSSASVTATSSTAH